MTTAALLLVKDELDILPHTLPNLLEQSDFAIVQDNASTDGTRDYLADLERADERLTVIDDPDPAYYQSVKVSALAALAAERGADWCIPADSDEWWYSPFGRIADVLEGVDSPVVTAAIYDHRCTALDPDDPNPIARMGWRTREPLPLHKIACRPTLPVTIEQGNHGVDYGYLPPVFGQLVIRHFPIRGVDEMIRKARNGAAAYAATDLPEDAGAHWRGWGKLSDEQLGEVFREHYWSAEPEAAGLIFDPVPCGDQREMNAEVEAAHADLAEASSRSLPTE